MIERQYGQHHLGEIFLKDSMDDCWEPWMKKGDEILDDEELIDAVYEALRRRRRIARREVGKERQQRLLYAYWC